MKDMNNKIKIGTNVPNEPSLNIKTFILSFMAIIWRRVWITVSIYCEHNKIKITSETCLKCLKFNIFSDAGIGNTLKPYIIKALFDGFLMPKFYRKNIYAERAVKLYKKSYEISKLNDAEKEIEFIKKYALSVFKNNKDKNNENDVINETNDMYNDISFINSDINNSDINNNNNNTFLNICQNIKHECNCKMCKLVNSWDVNISLIYSDDHFKNIIMKGLTTALNKININN